MTTIGTKALLRNLWKKKRITVTKVLGLIVGYVILIFLSEKIQHETSYDHFWKDSESIYRVALDITYENGEALRSAKNFHGSSELLNEELAEVTSHCNLTKDVVTIFNGPQQKIQDVDFIWSDPTFFKVFDRKIIAAQTPSLLENIHGVAISKSFGEKLFGKENALGKELTVNEGWKFVVDAVFEDIPENSHMKVDVVCAYKSLFYYMRNFDNTAQVLVDNPEYQYTKVDPYSQKRWRAPAQYRPYCYIKLDEGTPIGSVASRVGPLLKKVALPQNLKDADVGFVFQSISDIHLKSNLDHELSVGGNGRQVLFLGIIIVVVLMVCLINFISLTTISALENAKNYSIRMLNGSKYRQVFQMMLTENALLNLVAIGITIPLALWLIRSQLPSVEISSLTWLLLVLIAAAFMIIATLAPFLSVVKNNAFSIVQTGKQKLLQKWTSQKLMVSFQFSVAIILIICTIGIYKQMQFMVNSSLGFNGHQTLYSFTPMTMNQHPDLAKKLTTFRNEVSNLGDVASFTVSSSIPGKPVARLNDQVKALGAVEPYPDTFNEISIDDAYINAYDIQLLAGGNLMPEMDWHSTDVLLNRTAAAKMGYPNANDLVGVSITIGNTNHLIRGILADYHHVSLHSKVSPTIYHQNIHWDHSVGYYSFRLKSENISAVMDQIKRTWEQLYPKEEFIFSFSDKAFASQYIQDQKFNQILGYSTFLALFISCLGLWAVALYNTKKRIREIGIRKVNGAKVKEIMLTLNKDFIKWVAIAYVVACPLALIALNKWLENYAYKTAVGLWIFVIAGLAALAISLLTVSWQSFNAARVNPVEALRNE